MFDDYVEHTSSSVPGPGLAHGSLPPLQYEGFEPSPYDQDDARAEMYQDRTDVAPPAAPIFQLGEVQCPLSASLVSLVVSSDSLYMGLANNLIIQIELSRAEQFIRIQIPRKPAEFTIYKLFLDPSGRHLLVTSVQGENWYFYRGWKKPRQLKSFKMIIETVAWNKAALLSSSHSTSTRELLIGARNGTIYEAVLDAEEDFFKSQERYLQPVFTLPERHPVTGLKFDLFPPMEPKKALVLVTTATRIYQFVGIPDRRSEEGGRVFSALFGSYRDTAPKIVELPSNVEYSELHVYNSSADQAYSLPRTVAWMNSAGIYHGTLNFESNSDDLIDGAQLLPYPPQPSSPSMSPSRQNIGASTIPMSMSLTGFHFLLLYRDRVVGISNLNEQLAYEELLPLKPNEQVRGLTADPVRRTYWVYTDQSIWEIGVTNEHRDVWKIYLEKGKYDAALQYSNNALQRDKIMSAQAKAFFSEARYFQAASCYAQCSISFEEVTLQFLDAGERDALRSYLISRLERTRRTDLSQRMMLATWLVEFYLSKCNELDDLVASESIAQDVDNLLAERTILEDDLRHFFETYKVNLDPRTVYELIQGHGRTDMYLHFATVIGDFERVVEHWVMEEEWAKAIDVINRQSDLELYYRFAPVLMRHSPKEAVDAWLRQRALDPLRLVPALLRLQHVPRDPLSPNHAVRYLNHVIFEQGNTSPTIHNLMITFYASSPSAIMVTSTGHPEDDGPLLRFLSSAPSDPLTGKPYYDLDYALRLCKQGGRTQPCVHIYSKMGLWENSVDLALEKGDLELAKINADMPEDDDQLRKKLWLKIAKYVVQDKQDIKMAMRFLENTDLLKIEDILPFFPDFVVIDDFKEEICTALEGYSAHIDELKSEMDEATKNAEAIKQDIAALQKRFTTVDAAEKCSRCALPLMTRQFYVFPCHHTFHADCLIGLTKEFLPAHALRRILALQTELMKTSQAPLAGLDRGGPPTNRALSSLTHNPRQSSVPRALLSANFAAGVGTGARGVGRNLLSAGDRLRDLIIPDALAGLVTAPAGWIPGIGGGGAARRDAGEKDAEKAERTRRELEDLLAAHCPMCESVVAGLDKPFVQAGEVDSSWDL
ncbi:Pep3/Vps18/deep orange family-domain-containing protein [Epithele typhae]|uniref:Pep3/Vps18/deep orange family-domain-containing protein n=1 Tax=Epithele typhae TaxID=378194 RepID=UPI00200730E4|nr:Pep3/Vps18/deep orange family-domain-containing protein [Epithele typhae]KAH9944117.1 Pep3/Vps18/deep orange family-domain-containing protein [Epithele typhae]